MAEKWVEMQETSKRKRPFNPPRPPENTPAKWWKGGVCGVMSALPPGKSLKARLELSAYDLIESGDKRVEYRAGEYWVDRLVGREIGAMTFFRGQDGPQMTWEVKEIVRYDSCFDIHLGKRLA